ncbi:uncharacterized protein LOC107429249 [Ziziphus jujuba]|uniref:Uncharacterized protein LOC107429249 n=1 Tax=Ziziphus jujuba TaxID=326968 RepID=A0A6P4B0U2_ZIZJJ|nr:uncharacterized protein LOC107429249 [Ziziphus jujuba]
MLNHLGTRSLLSSYSTPVFAFASRQTVPPNRLNNSTNYSFQAQNLNQVRVLSTPCAARRRVRYEEDEEEEDDGEEYGHNEEIAMLEMYSQNARGEALIVHAIVDQQDVEVLIFKGFSSCLNYRTSPDPSKSILPARAVIKSLDRVKGPFDPSNIEYLQKGLTWEAFKTNLLLN